MPDRLDRYLAQERARPESWGEANGDCMLLLAGWLKLLGWPDFAAEWRGKYRDREGGSALLLALGGHAAVIQRALGKNSGEEPQRGDIGLLAFPQAFLGHVGAICTGKMWVMRSKGHGVTILRANRAMHWAVGFKE